MDENNRNEYTGRPESPAGTPDHSPVEGDWTAEPYPEASAPQAEPQVPPAEERQAALVSRFGDYKIVPFCFENEGTKIIYENNRE